MSKTITHFIWGYQALFRGACTFSATKLFRKIDSRIEPELFLVGIRIDEMPNRYPACVEPENNWWINSDAFDDTIQLANQVVDNLPESKLIHTHPIADKQHREHIFKRSICDVIEQKIRGCDDRPAGMHYVTSYPVKLEGYLVVIVAGLQSSLLDEYTHLDSNKIAIHEYRATTIPISLPEAIMEAFLREAAQKLYLPDPGSTLVLGFANDEILRGAGTKMMAGIAMRVDGFDIDRCNPYGLFDSVCRVASKMYERVECHGYIVLAKQNHQSLKPVIHFEHGPEINNSRSLRKLLELTSSSIYLHIDSARVWGLSEKPTDVLSEDVFYIEITENRTWTVFLGQKVLMVVEDGLPSLPRKTIQHAAMRRQIEDVFPDLNESSIFDLVSLIETAAKERHGTVLIITGDAKDEAVRLNRESTMIRRAKVTPELLPHLTPIDGAVLLNPNGECFAIGVILDGEATSMGDSSRGARYNSAIRYVQSRSEPTLAVVVSEDGGIDIHSHRSD